MKTTVIPCLCVSVGRYEHSARGAGGEPLRHGGMRDLTHHQQVCDGVRLHAGGQP